MAKKRTQNQEEEIQRQSRKDILRSRKESEQTRDVRIAVAAVGGLLLLVFLVAIVNELILVPGQAVASVNGEEITMRQWERRVEYERAQRIISLENQYDAFGGDVGIIQQYSYQTINELVVENEALAENVLLLMADEALILQEAEKRGITVSDAELDEEIGSFFNYFDGESPTPLPEPTETIAPTPSLTPIPTAVITDVVPTNTPFPTIEPGAADGEPVPTATAVSKESFDEQWGDVLTQFGDLGIDEEAFREIVRVRMIGDRLADVLAEENELPMAAEHASFFLLSFDTEIDANEVTALIQSGDFVTVWNTINSDPSDSVTGSAAEVLWRTREDVTSILGEQVSEVVFTLPPNVPSQPIEVLGADGTSRYYVLQVSGLEIRDLPEATFESNKQGFLAGFLSELAAVGVEINENWRSRIPSQPALDPKFLVPPTPDPALPDPTLPDLTLPDAGDGMDSQDDHQ